MNPFEVLEIAPGASPEDIKAAYHRLAKKWHPDRFSGPEKAVAEERFRALAEAFAMLKDPLRRPEAERKASGSPAPTPAPTPAVPSPSPAPAQDSKAAPRGPRDWYDQAKASFDAGDVEKALGLVTYALRQDPGQADFHFLHGEALLRLGGDKRAVVKSLETVLQLRPKDVDAMLMLAEVFQSLKMEARASRMREMAREINPRHKAFLAEARKAAQASPKAGAPSNALMGLLGRFLGKR